MNQNIYINELPSAEVTIYDNGTPVTVVIANGAGGSGVPYTGARQNVNLGEYGLTSGYVQLDTTPTTYTPGVGNIGWNDTVGTIETTLKGGVSLKVGRDMFERVVNKTGVQLTKASYQAVRVSTAQGQRLGVALAQANNDNNSADTIGLAVETIDINQEGMIFTVGEISGINTTGSLQGETWADGDVIYLSPTTAGRVTNVKPVAPQHLVVIGYVVYAHANNGKIYVKVMNGWELGELHDVDTTGATNGQVLTYNGSIWVPSTNGVGTVTNVSALTLGTSGTDLSSTVANPTTTPVITLNVPTASATNRGVLSSADWTTFNNKQNALTNPVTGTGTSGQVSYWTGSTTQSGSNNLFWDSVNNRLGINTNSPTDKLEILGTNVGLKINSNSVSNRSAWLVNDGGGGGQLYLFNAGNSNTIYINGAGSSFFNIGNLSIGTTTDSGFKLDVNGTTRSQGALTVTTGGATVTGISSFTGTTASDGGQLGSELLSSANWTLNSGWTGDFATGFSHSSGTATLTNTLAAVTNTYYLISYTVTNRTAGTFTITFGGYTSGNLSATGNVGPRATSTGTLVITPTTDFNGTIVFSIKVISASTASIQLRNSAGTITNEIRNNSSNTNTFIGLDAGARNISGVGTNGTINTYIGVGAGNSSTTAEGNTFTGYNAGANTTIGGFNSYYGRNSGVTNTSGGSNSFYGGNSGFNNTTAGNNSFFGVSSGFSNTTGGSNSFFGINSGYNNTTGANNIGFGVNAGRYINSGSNLTVVLNSVFLGNDTRALADSDANEIVIGYQGRGLGSNTTVIGNTSTTFGRFYGNLLLGTDTNSGFLLDVNGTARIQNSFTVTQGGIELYSTSGWFRMQAAGSTNSRGHSFEYFSNFTNTSGTPSAILQTVTFAPTSGTGVFSSIQSNPTINQTGGANGITRGLYVNPTLTAAADWRSIEWSNNTGWGLYGAGTANNYLAGSLGIGTTQTGFSNIHISKNITGGSSCDGIRISSTVQSDNSSAQIYLSFPAVQNTTFTLNNLYHFYALQGSFGASATVSNQTGFFAGSNLTGGVNNFGFRGSIPSASNRWNLYMDGTALNYLNGSLLVGTTTDAGYKLDVNGTARIVDTFRFDANIFDNRGNVIIQQSSSATATNRDLTIGNGTYGRHMFTSKSYSFTTGTHPALGSYTFYHNGETSTSATAVPNIYFKAQTPQAATNNNGGDFIIELPSGTGTGRNGRVAIGNTNPSYSLDLTGTFRVTGASQFEGDVTITDADNLVLGTTTGTKIGTATSQKLGFWNATPIVQPTTGVAAATRVGGGGTTLTDSDTFDGYTLAQIVKALRNTGILA